MAEVVTLETRAKAVNRQTVEVLEAALAQAKAGAIQEVAIAIVYEDHATGWRRSGSESISTMIGAASILLHNLHKKADEQAFERPTP